MARSAREPLPPPGDPGAPICSCGQGRTHPNGTEYLECPVCDRPTPPGPGGSR